MSTAPKQWTVKVVSPATGALQVLRDNTSLLEGLPIGPGGVTPVELLLASAATCLALSCNAAFPMRKLERVDFQVTATGRKAHGLPSRLEILELRLDFGGRVPAVEAQALATLAKQMCTVTNSITTVPPVAIEVTVADQP